MNVLYGMANLFRGQVTARITPASWWANMKNGWVWDLDDFLVNQIGHPFQGSNYFNAGRANGLTVYESAGIAAFGSGSWEYFGETNRPSLNDFMNTTLGGIALGEMIHRTGWRRHVRRELWILAHHRDHLAPIGIPRILDKEPELRVADQHVLQQHRVAGGRAAARFFCSASSNDGTGVGQASQDLRGGTCPRAIP